MDFGKARPCEKVVVYSEDPSKVCRSGDAKALSLATKFAKGAA